MDLSREEFLSRWNEMREDQRVGFAQVNSRLDTLNGRLGSSEQNIARQDERIKTLETAESDAKKDARIDRRITAAVAALAVALVEGIIKGWHAISAAVMR